MFNYATWMQSAKSKLWTNKSPSVFNNNQRKMYGKKKKKTGVIGNIYIKTHQPLVMH